MSDRLVKILTLLHQIAQEAPAVVGAVEQILTAFVAGGLPGARAQACAVRRGARPLFETQVEAPPDFAGMAAQVEAQAVKVRADLAAAAALPGDQQQLASQYQGLLTSLSTTYGPLLPTQQPGP